MADILNQRSAVRRVKLSLMAHVPVPGTLIQLVYNLCLCHSACRTYAATHQLLPQQQHLVDTTRQPAGNLSNKIIITIYYNK